MTLTKTLRKAGDLKIRNPALKVQGLSYNFENEGVVLVDSEGVVLVGQQRVMACDPNIEIPVAVITGEYTEDDIYEALHPSCALCGMRLIQGNCPSCDRPI